MKMKIKSLVEKMGGVQRFTFEPLIPTSRKSMSKFLDITKEEFSDYLDYLELFGGGNIEWNGGDLGFFYGENINYQKNSQISERLEKYKNRIPDNFLPISSNEFGDLICLCTQGERIGQIFYWDHENEWDEEDYFDEFGVQMPEEVKFQNIYLIGKNLYDCFSRMIPV